MMDAWLQDVRFGVRTLFRKPGFALVAIMTLALGIGGNTAVFSVVNSVLLKPLPFSTADRLVWVWGREFNGQPGAAVSPPDFRDYVRGVNTFERLAAFSAFSSRRVYEGGDRPIELLMRSVTHDLLAVLGQTPALGRGFTEAETLGETAEVMMISHGLWGRLFGFDEAVIGRAVRISGDQYTIVGVLPADLAFPQNADAWMPLTFGAVGFGARASHFLRPLGLLREGVSVADAQAAMDAVSARLEAEYPETNEDWYPIGQPLQSVLVASARPTLGLLFGAIAFVLLIACANVANLLLARGATRKGEIAVRTALGASRSRVIRQLMTESLILATLAGVGGVVIAVVGVDALARLEPGNIPGLDAVTLDGTVLLFTAALALGVGIVFGLAPALGLSGRGVGSGIRTQGRGGVGGGQRARSVLVGAEVALSLVLLIGALLLARSLNALTAVDPGFDPEAVMAVSLSYSSLGSDEERMVALDEIVSRLRSNPGVVGVGAASSLPFGASDGDTYVYAEDRPPEQLLNVQNTALIRFVDEGYFETLGIPVDQGRVFERTDDRSAPRRVVINEALAAFLFPDEDPVGRNMVVAFDGLMTVEVLGVVKDVRQFALGTPSMREFYLPLRQFPRSGVQVIVRGASGLPAADQVRETIWDLDPTQPLSRVVELSGTVRASLAAGRFQALVLGLFAALAAGLAGIGIYGVLSESVNERRREVGVRLAMGAQPSAVVQEVVSRGLRVAVIGIVVGGVAALAMTRLLSALLFEVGPMDPVAFIAAPVFLLCVVLVSSWLPAFQASRVDPVQALRE